MYIPHANNVICPLEVGFCMNRNGGTGGGWGTQGVGGCTQRMQTAWQCLGSVLVCTAWVGCFSLTLHQQAEKTVLPKFLAVKLFSQVQLLAKRFDHCKPVMNVRGGLQGPCEKLGKLKNHNFSACIT